MTPPSDSCTPSVWSSAVLIHARGNDGPATIDGGCGRCADQADEWLAAGAGRSPAGGVRQGNDRRRLGGSSSPNFFGSSTGSGGGGGTITSNSIAVLRLTPRSRPTSLSTLPFHRPSRRCRREQRPGSYHNDTNGPDRHGQRPTPMQTFMRVQRARRRSCAILRPKASLNYRSYDGTYLRMDASAQIAIHRARGRRYLSGSWRQPFASAGEW